MLTDAILKEATAEAERFRLSLVPEDGEPHKFSTRFLRKMERLIRRANHPIRYQVMRTAAAVALAIVTLFGAVMAVSPEARAAVIGWIKETFGVYTHYSNNDTNTEDTNIDPVQYEYHFSVIPEGYVELMAEDIPGGKMYLYMGDLGNILQFTYTYDPENNSLFLETENYEYHTGFVNNLPADIYIALKENETSVIIWQDQQNGVIFEIHALSDQTGLIEIAETVEKNKK